VFEEFDRNLKDRFFEGIAMGMGCATIAFVLAVLLIPVMFTFN